jgi:cobalamin-dependent methionine synthase I
MYDMLELGCIGVTINENCILMPEKSVTAVVGIHA